MLLFLLSLFLINTVSYNTAEPIQAKRYKLNLDLPPQERWLEIAADYKWFASTLVKDINSIFPPHLLPILETIALYADEHFPAPYPDEMRGYAKGLNVSFTGILMVNLVYELTAFCTSIVAQDKAGNVYLGRNFDFNSAVDLRKAAFMVDFQSKDRTIYSGSVFLGQVGLPTAQRPNAVSISSNQRSKGPLIVTLLTAILDKRAIPMTFFLRSVAATDHMDFDTAVAQLSTGQLIADVYYIVGGVKPGQGVVITRNRFGTVDVRRLDLPTRWFLVETNYDHWTTPPPDDDRRDVAIKALNQLGQDNVNLMALFKVLSIKPVLNDETIFTAVMQASDPTAFNTWIEKR